MAGDWFPMGFWRSRCPEVVLVSSRTRRDRHEVLGWLCDLWSWVSSESADGRVPGVRVSDLPSVIGADAAFWEAVQGVNWLAEDASGIVVPNWEHWLSESAKKRAKERTKKRAQRSQIRPDPVPEVSPKCPRKKGTTLQDNTVHIKKNPHVPHEAAKIPASLDVTGFRIAWDAWIAHRAEIKKKLTPSTATAQLKKLAEMGVARAVACIEHTIEKGWTGLRESQPESPGGFAQPSSEPLRALTKFEMDHGTYDPHRGLVRDAAGKPVLDRLCRDINCEHCKPRRVAA